MDPCKLHVMDKHLKRTTHILPDLKQSICTLMVSLGVSIAIFAKCFHCHSGLAPLQSNYPLTWTRWRVLSRWMCTGMSKAINTLINIHLQLWIWRRLTSAWWGTDKAAACKISHHQPTSGDILEGTTSVVSYCGSQSSSLNQIWKEIVAHPYASTKK